ncbi:MAG: hypothetical protein QM778_23370 [Myxococcales bacterium]
MPHEHKYEALVSARSREEAIEIAAEALRPDQQVVRSEAEDVSDSEGPDSFHVTLWFVGGGRRGEAPGD